MYKCLFLSLQPKEECDDILIVESSNFQAQGKLYTLFSLFMYVMLGCSFIAVVVFYR